jgi:hypothetical protein
MKKELDQKRFWRSIAPPAVLLRVECDELPFFASSIMLRSEEVRGLFCNVALLSPR